VGARGGLRGDVAPGAVGGEEQQWLARVAAVVELVDGVQAAIEAETAEGRWARQSGPSDRKALEYVCELALDAVAGELELDCRRLALATGISKSTADRALKRLCWDGWLEDAGRAELTHGA
jgi:DNA-binding transcriptional ArsR family regulator